MTRELGRTGFEVTVLGLGGQGSLQWTPSGIAPEQIILKAFELGVNYFDTSNVYGPSQSKNNSSATLDSPATARRRC
jgi:aryl-alcohol dehydrogenase-like predicted oxidoreductase